MGQGFVTIHVLPHIRQYLLVRLAPGERLAEPTTQDLINHMSRLLRVQVLHAACTDPSNRPKSSLQLLVRDAPAHGGRWSRDTAQEFNGMLEETYRRHSHTWMDWLMDTTGAGVSVSLEAWRTRYGVTEKHQAFETARRAYARHREREGRMLPHGGARYVKRYVQQRFR